MYAVAKCFSPEKIYDGFQESFYPRDDEIQRNTKLLVTVLNGGKGVNSTVKFSKFYLLIDAYAQGSGKLDPLCIPSFYQKFLVAIKKAITSTKQGEAGFKQGIEGCFFNANATIVESFKMMEDAIALSGANDEGRRLF